MQRSHFHVYRLVPYKSHVRQFRKIESDVAILLQLRGLRPGGGGGTRLSSGRGGVPLGFENLTLSQCARRTKNTPCHNIPYKKLAYDTLS